MAAITTETCWWENCDYNTSWTFKCILLDVCILQKRQSYTPCLNFDTETYSKVLYLFLYVLLELSTANAVVMMILVSRVFITAFTFPCSDYGRLLVSLLWARWLSWYSNWATGWTVRRSNPGGVRFSTRPNRPWGPPGLLYNGYRVFPGGKVRLGCAADHSPPCSVVVMEE